MIVTKQFKITKLMSAKKRRSNLSENSILKMVPCQFCLAPWLVQTRFMAIFMAVVGLTIATTPASAFSFKTDNLIKKNSVNSLGENHPSLTKIQLIGNEPIDKLNLLHKQEILPGKYTDGNQVWQLLQKAESNIQEITQASEVSNEIIDGKVFYKYHHRNTNKTLYTETYTNTWKAAASPPKKKIPEPSTMLGLIAIASLFVTQRKKIKVG